MTQCLAGSEPSETCTLLTVLRLQGVPPESCVEDYEAWSQPECFLHEGGVILH